MSAIDSNYAKGLPVIVEHNKPKKSGEHSVKTRSSNPKTLKKPALKEEKDIQDKVNISERANRYSKQEIAEKMSHRKSVQKETPQESES